MSKTGESKAIRIIAASDQAVYLRGLETLALSMPDFHLVGEARSCAETLQLCQLTHPEIVLMDLRHAREHELIPKLNQAYPALKIVVLQDCTECVDPNEYEDLPVYIFSRDVTEDEFKVALRQVQRDPASAAEQAGHPIFPHQLRLDSDEDDNDEPPPAEPAKILPQTRSEEILTRELLMAGRIQADILPEEAPQINGWDFSAVLIPAYETSGDFYDFIPLIYKKWGIVVADVTDKGMGAALFMALTSTLLRTYATRYPTLPGLTMSEVSERILSDTRGNMFVTTFYGILEPGTGRLIYANAGHPPGILVTNLRGRVSFERLRPTGMALGVSEQASWKQKMVRFNPGDMLVLYTDGISEAQNPQGEYFGEDGLIDAALELYGQPAGAVCQGLVDAVQDYTHNAPRQDDIALIVIRREV